MKPTSQFEDKLRPFFAALLLGVVAAVVFLLVAVPQFDKLKITDQVLSDRQKAVSHLAAKLAALAALDETSQTSTLQTLISALPLEEPFRQALLNLDSLLVRHHLGGSQIKVDSGADFLGIKFMAVGPLSSLRQFISDTEKVLPISTTSSLEVSKIHQSPVASDSSSVYQGEIVVKIFFKSPPQTIGRASDPLPIITSAHLKTLGLLTGFEIISPISTDDAADFTQSPRLFPE